jgi:hypothetical protein
MPSLRTGPKTTGVVCPLSWEPGLQDPNRFLQTASRCWYSVHDEPRRKDAKEKITTFRPNLLDVPSMHTTRFLGSKMAFVTIRRPILCKLTRNAVEHRCSIRPSPSIEGQLSLITLEVGKQTRLFTRHICRGQNAPFSESCAQ